MRSKAPGLLLVLLPVDYLRKHPGRREAHLGWLRDSVQHKQGAIATLDASGGVLSSPLMCRACMRLGKLPYLHSYACSADLWLSMIVLLQVGLVSSDYCKRQNPYAALMRFLDFRHVICTGGVAGR